MASDIVLTGSCACRHVRYTSTSLPHCVVNCHCTTCRKLSGAPYQTWADFAPGAVSWIVPPTFRRSSEVSVRSFCEKCGSSMSMAYDYEPERFGIAAGTIDDKDVKGEMPKATVHLFLKEKASWFDLPEDGTEI